MLWLPPIAEDWLPEAVLLLPAVSDAVPDALFPWPNVAAKLPID